MATLESPARRQTTVRFLGRIGYAEGESLQNAVREHLLEGRGGEEFLLLEHDPVFTLGRSADRSDLLASDDWLVERGIGVAECDRGGQVTYHGPGQLVGYPILDLKPDRRDIRRYVKDLQTVLIRTLAEFDIRARAPEASDPIGVWVGDAKIASIGVHLRRWVTTHGFALNVSTDMAHFEGIVPCGLSDVQMTSIEHLTGEKPSLELVSEVVARVFLEVFERQRL